MNKLPLWESKFNNDYIFFNTIKEYNEYLNKNNQNIIFRLQSSYKKNDEPISFLDSIAIKNNLEFIYTDKSHPIAISNDTFLLDNYIDPDFFNTNKEEFIKVFTEHIKKQINQEKCFIAIPDFVLTDELIELIISKKFNNSSYTLKTYENINLTEEQIKKLQDNFIDFRVNNQQISSKYIFANYTLKELLEKRNITIYTNKDYNYENLKYINESAIIEIKNNDTYINEDEYIKKTNEIINILKNHNRKYNIEIKINNRQKLINNKLLDNLPNNINIYIINDLFNYDLDTFKKEEEILESIAKPIRESNLSPLEKYLAAYNKVKQFKKYKENEENKEESRYLRFILNNEYLVCVGFAKLLEEILNRINIPNKTLNVGIDISYDNGFTMEEINLKNAGHARNMIKIDDDKYNIHGIYITDPTWDNDLSNDLYLNSLMTFDRKKEAKRLEKLNTEDLLLDFHNLKEFTNKIEYFIKNDIHKSTEGLFAIYKNKPKEALELAYNQITNELNKIYSLLFEEQYENLYNTYIYPIIISNNIKEKEENLKKLLTKHYQLILPLTNNNISLSTILTAATESKKTLEGYNEEEIKKWLENTLSYNKTKEKQSFPYKYNKDNPTEAYLEDAFPEENKKRV